MLWLGLWLLLGSGVVMSSSRNQAGDEDAEQGFAASARIVHELVTAQVISLEGGIDRSRASTSQRVDGTARRHTPPR